VPSKQIEAVSKLYRDWGAALGASSDMPLDEWQMNTANPWMGLVL